MTSSRGEWEGSMGFSMSLVSFAMSSRNGCLFLPPNHSSVKF